MFFYVITKQNFSIFAIMEYNTYRTTLFLPEYGRIIQSLVEICKTKADRNERNEMAEAIVKLMSQRNPEEKDEEKYQNKLWDHLYILANYQLDIDAPYPIPNAEESLIKPSKMSYPKLDFDYKFYGKSILQLIEVAINMQDGEEKEALVQVIANNMKKSYNVYNKEHVQDEVIIRHLTELSKGKLSLDNLESLEKSKIYPNQGINHQATTHSKHKNKNYKHRSQNNHNNQKRIK